MAPFLLPAPGLPAHSWNLRGPCALPPRGGGLCGQVVRWGNGTAREQVQLSTAAGSKAGRAFCGGTRLPGARKRIGAAAPVLARAWGGQPPANGLRHMPEPLPVPPPPPAEWLSKALYFKYFFSLLATAWTSIGFAKWSFMPRSKHF